MTNNNEKPNGTNRGPQENPKGVLKRTFERAADYHPNFFPAEIGLDPQKYHQGKSADYAGVKFFAEQGWIHGVHAHTVPGEKGGATITLQHWVHRPNGNNVLTPFLEIEAVPVRVAGKDFIRVSRVSVQGENIDINDRKTVNAAISTCQQALEQLRLERRMPLLNKIAETAGLKTKPLPDTYKDGNARMAYEAGRKNITRRLRFPKQFLPAITAFFEEGYEATRGTPVLFNATARSPEKNGPEYTLYGELKQQQDKTSTNFTLKMARRKTDAQDPYTERDIVRFRVRPSQSVKNADMLEIVAADMDGRAQRVSDHKNMVRLLHFAHDSVLQVRQGVMPDLAKILSYTNTQKAISGMPLLKKEDGARYTYRVLGGNPSGPRLFQQDGGIGANCFVHLYEWHDDKGAYKSDAVMVDCGITPLNRDTTGFDGMMSFAGSYFEHRNNPKHKPKHKVSTLMITHPHLDHFLGVPHLLLAGYVIDHLVCNEATRMYIEKACRDLDVPKEFMPKKWTVINKEMDLKSGPFDMSFGWMPHSAITNWVNVKTAEGSILHFSDAKVDDTVLSHPALNIEKIKSLKPTMAIVDSTRAGQEEETESEQSIEQKIVDFANQHPDKGMIGFHIGSNAARMAGFVNAYGRTGRDTVIFGAAKRFLKQVLDKVGLRNGFGLKAHARIQYGKDVVNFTPRAKRANEILNGAAGHQGLLATGTHNEVMSIANRLVENKDQKNLGFITPQKYIAVMSQTGIPGSQKGWNKLIEWFERRGFEYRVIHASGHEGRKGIEKMLDWAGAKYGVVTHGNMDQRANAEKIVRAKGMESINPVEQDVIQVSDKNGCRVIAQEPSVMIYFSIKRPAEQHYGGGEDVEYYAYMAPPEIRSATGEMIKDIAKARPGMTGGDLRVRQDRNQTQRDPILNMDGADLSTRKKRVNISLPDYLVQNGIMSRVMLDCETTQLGRYAWITQFAAKQSSWFNDEDVRTINIRQTLPQTILPDLNALLATGIAPTELYKTGENFHPPRQFYNEITKFLRESKLGGETHSDHRIWVDANQAAKDPTRRTRGETPAGVDPYMARTLDYSYKKEDSFINPRAIPAKTLVGGFNNTKADDVWLQHAGFRAGALRYSPTNTGGMRRFDLRNMARMFAYLRPDKFKVRQKPENPQFPDFTVQGIMKANNLGYEKYNAHEASSDVDMQDNAILKHMLGIDPELFTQCMLNANPKEVKKFLTGTHNGMLYPRHLMTYINNNAFGASANIGVYVGRSTDKKYMNKALVFNVSDFDPKDFIGMGAQEISEIMSNRNHRMHKAFEVIHLNRQPLLGSADRGFSVGANRGTSVETMKGYKHFIERHPQMAANMIKAMEMAKFFPDADPRAPMEERVFAAPFMEMSSSDKSVAKLFEPQDREFTDAVFADDLNMKRAHALDEFHSTQLRERYVAVMYQVERETKQLFGTEKHYLHPDDRDREKAKEKARIHGLIDSEAMSLGRLENQIKDVKANWEKRMEGKTPEQVSVSERILRESVALVAHLKERINAGDPDWALQEKDYALLGLNDNISYGRYQRPLSKNPNPKPKAPDVA